MSSSLLSDPSTVKLLARDRRPLTENCPAEPTPAPTPGPATLPSVCGGGAMPGNNRPNSSKVRVKVTPPSGNVETSFSEYEPPRWASLVLISANMLDSAGCDPVCGVACATGGGLGCVDG